MFTKHSSYCTRITFHKQKDKSNLNTSLPSIISLRVCTQINTEALIQLLKSSKGSSSPLEIIVIYYCNWQVAWYIKESVDLKKDFFFSLQNTKLKVVASRWVMRRHGFPVLKRLGYILLTTPLLQNGLRP